jgi:hypothetical protein
MVSKSWAFDSIPTFDCVTGLTYGRDGGGGVAGGDFFFCAEHAALKTNAITAVKIPIRNGTHLPQFDLPSREETVCGNFNCDKTGPAPVRGHLL